MSESQQHECEAPGCDRDFESKKALGSHFGQVHGSRTAMVECRNCEEMFEVPKHREDKAVYCSDECMGEKYAEVSGSDHPNYDKVEVKCAWCGDGYSLPESLAERAENNFCSRECKGEYLSQNPMGEHLPSAEEMRGPDHPLWRGGESGSYAGMWDKQRARAKQRDGYRCVDCGVEEDEYKMKLDVHHIIPYRSFDDPVEANRLNNLVTVCRKCHANREYNNGGVN